MQLRIYLFFSQWIILYNECNFVIAKPLVGANVELASEGEFTFAACFTDRVPQNQLTPYQIFCGGAAITRNHVLTAAHCIANKFKNETQIIIGSINILNGMVFYPFWWINYNDWTIYTRKPLQFQVNDIAVTKLSQQLPNQIFPVALSPLHNVDLYEKNVVTVGWGVTDNNVASLNLRKVQLMVFSKRDCERRVKAVQGERITIHIRNLCTATQPYALLHVGDSGGPLLFEDTIIGVNKATIPIPEIQVHPQKLNVHTGIDYYRRFILFVTNNNFIWF